MGHDHVFAQHAQTFQVLRGAHPVVAQAGLDVAGTVVEVQGQRHAVVVGQPLGLLQQPGRHEVGAEGHGPGPHPPVKSAVVVADDALDDGDGLVRIVRRQVDRIGQVGDVGADDDAAAGLLIGPQSGVQVLGAAGVNKGGSAVLEQFSNAQQRGQVFFLGGHRALEPEHVGQVVGAETVREDAPRGMGVADVHMTVDQAGSYDHPRCVNDPVGGDIGQLRRLAHLRYAAAFYRHRPVADDAPLAVHGDDVTGVFDFQRSVRHLCPRRGWIVGHYTKTPLIERGISWHQQPRPPYLAAPFLGRRRKQSRSIPSSRRNPFGGRVVEMARNRLYGFRKRSRSMPSAFARSRAAASASSRSLASLAAKASFCRYSSRPCGLLPGLRRELFPDAPGARPMPTNPC